VALSIVYTDADNTLWDTDSIYRAAQLRLLEAVEQIAGAQTEVRDRLGFVRDYDQALASEHHARLRYPPELLAHALLLGLRRTSPMRAAQDVIRLGTLPETVEVVGRFQETLKHTPPLLPNVPEGLRLAVTAGLKVYVVSEGSHHAVMSALAAHELLPYVSQVLTATKSATLYQRLSALAKPDTAAMIGDQLDRDIVPAREGGLIAVWIPGAFAPKWVDRGMEAAATFVAQDFYAAVSWLTARGNR